MTYKELIADAEKYYKKIAKDSPFIAMYEARKYIASKIDLCEDRNEHLDILQWTEYQTEYAPMTKEWYERRKAEAKRDYENELRLIEKKWMEQGKNSPDYHKI